MIFMKNRIIISVTALLSFVSVCSAQNLEYPKNLNDSFLAADSKVTPQRFTRPVICVSSEESCRKIAELGGVPVLIPRECTDFNTLRETAANIDGFMVSDSDSPLLLKAVLEQNVPVFGSSPLVDTLNLHLRRMPETLSDLGRFVRKAETFRHAKELMDRITTIDSHTDFALQYDKFSEENIGRRSPLSQISLQKMREGHMNSIYLGIYIRQKELTDEGYKSARERYEHLFDLTMKDVEKNAEWCGIARNRKEAEELHRHGKIAFFLGVENGYPINHDLGMIGQMADRGITYLTLCHSRNNQICSSCSKDQNGGLTEFGRKVVKELNRLGIAIDLSHASDGTFRDVCQLSKTPVVLTHSGARDIYNRSRNITDDMLRTLKKNGGVIQIVLYQGFLGDRKTNQRIGLKEMIDHMEHCISIAGIDHVGVGSDICGGGGGWNYFGANDAINLTVALLEKGYSDSDIEKIWGGNYLRVLDQVQAYAAR